MKRRGSSVSSIGRRRRWWFVAISAAVQLSIACSGSNAKDRADAAPPDDDATAGSSAGHDPGGSAGQPAAGDQDASLGGATVLMGEGGSGGLVTFPGAGDGGSAVPDANVDAGAGGASDVAFVPAAHPPFPLVTAHGGPVIQNVELVPVYFGDDPLRADLESFNTWVVSSDYWKTVGADYGVLPGTRLPAARFAEVPATSTTDVAIASWLDERIADGSLPKPSAQTLFALFYPAGTTITVGAGEDTGTSCSGFAGIHRSASIANATFTGSVPFVIIPRCSFSAGDELLIATDVATHEYIEAATDPFFKSNPAWIMDGQVGQPLEAWQMLTGLEVADLCENQSYDIVDGFTVQDMWSNSAAQSNHNPCQPSDPQHPFFMVSADDTIYHAQPGATVTVHAMSWSNLRAPDWSIGINWGDVPDSDFDGHAALSRTTVNNGDDVTVTITVPVNPPVVGNRSVYRFTIDSIDPINPNFSHPWPVMIVVP